MKKLILIALVALSFNAMCQTTSPVNKNYITISGRLSVSMIKLVEQEPFIAFYDDYNDEDPATGQNIPIILHGNEFSVKFTPRRNLGYFSLGKGLIRTVSFDAFLIARGDSIFLDATSPKQVVFSGKGSEKLNYQHWAGKLLDADNRNFGPEVKWPEIADFFRHRLSMHLAVALDSLQKDVNIGPDSIKNLLRLSTSSCFSREYLLVIDRLEPLDDTVYHTFLKKEVNFLITQQNGFLVSDPFLIRNCFMYTSYLFDLNQDIARIKVRNRIARADIVYPNIKAEYTGLLRDRILPYCFLRMLKVDANAIGYIDDALSLIQDSSSREIIERVKAAKASGASAYAFDLATLDGKRIKLEDLKGKVVILDTYYYGCVHCRDLALGLESVARYFNGRRDIVYISLDGVARDFNTFQKGAKSKLYGLPQTIYTWTEGMSEHHPFLVHYQYISYPNLLVIGKDGRVIADNPEVPIDAASEKRFIALIEKNL